MAEGLTSTVVVSDRLKQRTKVSVSFDPSIFGNWFDKSGDLWGNVVQPYTQGLIVARSDNFLHAYAEPKYGDYTITDPEYSTVDQKAIIIMREAGTGKQRRIEIPAPKASMFEDVKGEGKRVTTAAGEDIATKLSNLGLNVSFKYGWLKSKK